MRHGRRWTGLVVAAAVVGAGWGISLERAWGDQFQLKDGRTFSGTMSRNGDQATIRTDAGQTVTTPFDEIVKVTLTDDRTPAQVAEADWKQSELQIKKADAIAAIIGLHQKFLEKYPDQPISEAVRTSLVEYQKLAGEDAVKFRGRWMAAAQVEVTLKAWEERAKPAIALYRLGQVREALATAKQIVQADDENPGALTIAGLAAFRLNDLKASREYFTKLSAADPSSPLAENNLAVICAQQNLPAEGFIHYTRALEAGPGNRLLLDNIEEALSGFARAGGDMNATPYRNLVRQFNQAEPRMEAEMGKQGMYRFGSTWVGKDEFTRLTSSRAGIVGSLKDLESQYTTARQAVAAINGQIAQAASDYNSTLANVNSLNATITGGTRYGIDTTATLAQRDGLMQNLTTIRTQKDALEAQRDQAMLSLGTLFGQADKLRSELATADAVQFSGFQRLMELGEDAAPPAPAPLAASSVAAAAPAAGPAGGGAAPAPPADQYQDQVIQNYQTIATPIGIPYFPPFGAGRGFENGGGRDHDHGPGGHDHDQGHGGASGGEGAGAPSGPRAPSAPSVPSAPGDPIGPSAPGVPVNHGGGTGTGTGTGAPATPAPAAQPVRRPVLPPAGPGNAVPQGGPNSPWTN